MMLGELGCGTWACENGLILSCEPLSGHLSVNSSSMTNCKQCFLWEFELSSCEAEALGVGRRQFWQLGNCSSSTQAFAVPSYTRCHVALHCQPGG